MIRRLLLACLLLIPFAARAATPGVWTAAGPDGATVLALAVDPVDADIAYAGTEGGLFETHDAGESWSASSLRDLPVTALAVDPKHPEVIYAGTGQGLYQSADGGVTWLLAESPIGISTVEQIVIDPIRTENVYALIQNGLEMDLVRSTDGGENWASARRGLVRDLTSLAIDPKHPEVLYAGTEAHGVFSTYDRGDQWRRRGHGAPALGITTLAVDTVKTSRLYAGTQSRGIYLSTDGGITWKRAPSNPALSAIRVLVAQPRSLGVVWAGTTVSPGEPRAGVFRTTNGGTTWAPAGGGLVAPSLHALAISASSPRTVYAGVQARGVYRWTEDAPAWTLASGGLRPVFVTRVAADPAHAGHVLAGTIGFGVLATRDGGASWTPVDSRPLFFTVRDLEYDLSRPDRAYAVGQTVADRSLDGGATWRPLDFRGATAAYVLAADPSHAGQVYAATHGGIYHSSDFGLIWLGPSDPLGCFEVVDMKVAPGSGTVYASGHPLVGSACAPDMVFFRSTDGGLTWQRLTGYDREQVYALAVEPLTGTVFAGYVGVLRSTDGGDTWTETGAIGSKSTPAIFTLFAVPGIVYAGGTGHVWESRDAGLSWQEVGTGLADQTVVDLSRGPDGVLWAATTRGVFRLVP
jgi:photosystem II stability/assembly factor-like uncharacterized protein